MRYLDVKPWEANHPLNGKPCPVTGRMVYIEDPWKVNRPDYRLRTGILEPGVVLSLPVGYTKIQDTHTFFKNLMNICKSPHLNRDNFVLIEDYSFHSGSDYEGRMSYIKRMIDEINPAGVVFITQSVNWRLSIRMAKILGGHAFPITYAGSYRESLNIASEILGRPISGMLTKFTDDKYDNGLFSFTVKQHNPNAMIADYSGRIQTKDISPVIELCQRLPENPKLASNYSVIHDLTSLASTSIMMTIKLLSAVISDQCNGHHAPVWIITKSSFVKTCLFLLSRFPSNEKVIRIFSTRNEALTEFDKLSEVSIPEASELRIQTAALNLLDNITWDKPGYYELEAVTDPLLKPLALVLGALKQDFDYHIQIRQSEADKLELTHRRLIRLSMEIEESLHNSEVDRKKAEALSKENLNIAHEITQSQKEVFLVLADYVDERAGYRFGYTRALAGFVKKLSGMIGYSPEDQERLHDATLLFHVGYIGVADDYSIDEEEKKRAHCILGSEVLGKIYAVMMQFGGRIAKSHHEKWNGTGIPDAIAGESIPQEARLVYLAEFILAQEPESLDNSLLREAAVSLDPGMVVTVRSNLLKILEWKKEISQQLKQDS
jgi:HD-GYP domain-containing protein (c-di-GMP phosphodiesterase class II)